MMTLTRASPDRVPTPVTQTEERWTSGQIETESSVRAAVALATEFRVG